MAVRRKEDLVVGKDYYLALLEDSKYADKVKLERIVTVPRTNNFIPLKQTQIHVSNAKKQVMVFDVRQVGIGETPKEAGSNFLML